MSPPRASGLRATTIRRYLEALGEKQLVTAATELTYREPLADFLRAAATELGFGKVTINAELNLDPFPEGFTVGDIWPSGSGAAEAPAE